MQNLGLEKLSTTELLDIRDYVDGLLKDRVADERREIERTLARIGATGTEGAGRGHPRSTLKGTTVSPKYRDPATGETWAGRGARPRWLQAHLKQGRKLEHFAIAAQSARKKQAKRKRTTHSTRTVKGDRKKKSR